MKINKWHLIRYNERLVVMVVVVPLRYGKVGSQSTPQVGR